MSVFVLVIVGIIAVCWLSKVGKLRLKRDDCIIVFLLLGGLMAALSTRSFESEKAYKTGRGEDVCCKSRDITWHEIQNENSRRKHYDSSDDINVDFMSLANDQGVFGLKWGDRPLRGEYKVPCEVDYKISHIMFNQMKLVYGDNGLFSVTLHATPANLVPDFYSELPKVNGEDMQAKFIQDACLPVFIRMKELAEHVLNQRIPWSFTGDKLIGVSKSDGEGYFGVVRYDVRGENAEMLFCVMKCNK